MWKLKRLTPWGTMVARLKLEEIDGRAPPAVEPAAQFDPTRGNSPGPECMRIDSSKCFLDLYEGGAWLFLVGGVICLVNSDNERDLEGVFRRLPRVGGVSVLLRLQLL